MSFLSKMQSKYLITAAESGTIEVYLDILDEGNVYSSDRPYIKIKCKKEDMISQVREIGDKLAHSIGTIRSIMWSAGNDGKDGDYTGDGTSLSFDQVPWHLFSKDTKEYFQGLDEVEVMPVLKLNFPNLTGKELKSLR